MTLNITRTHAERMDSDECSGGVMLLTNTPWKNMHAVADRSETPTAIRTDLGDLRFVGTQ